MEVDKKHLLYKEKQHGYDRKKDKKGGNISN